MSKLLNQPAKPIATTEKLIANNNMILNEQEKLKVKSEKKENIIIENVKSHFQQEEFIAEKELIIKVDEKVMNFFDTYCLDPIKFLHLSIENYLISINTANQPNSSEISKTELIKFQNEYNTFINKKKTLVHSLRENVKQIEAMDLENFDQYLCKKFGTNKEVFSCTICNKNSYRSKKALSTHQRKCKKDFEAEIESEDDDEIEVEE
jgi:hypothetical protein